MKAIRDTFGLIIERNANMPSLPTDWQVLSELLSDRRCIIFRGFRSSIEEFEEITSTLTNDFMTYQGGGFTTGPLARSIVNKNKTLLTATGNTQTFPMPLHGEMYYLGKPPDLIWFYCATPPIEGGETTIGDGVKIFQDMPQGARKRLSEHRIRYERRQAYGDWQPTYQTDMKSTVEEFCKKQSLELCWDEDDSAITRFYASALRKTTDGESAFINSLLLLARGEEAIRSGLLGQVVPEAKTMKPAVLVRWEDGSPIEPEIIDEIERTCVRNEIEVSWREGDIVLLDNRSVMHGRRGSIAKERKVLVRMGSLRPHADE